MADAETIMDAVTQMAIEPQNATVMAMTEANKGNIIAITGAKQACLVEATRSRAGGQSLGIELGNQGQLYVA